MELENEKLVTRFLYGELPEDERFDLESRFIADKDLFEEIKAVEDELIRKYLCGEMDPVELSLFERSFLSTSKRRERVDFSRQLLETIERQQAPVAANRLKKNKSTAADGISIWESLSTLWLTPKGLAAGAFVLIVTLLGAWFMFTDQGRKNAQLVKNDGANSDHGPAAVITTPSITPPAESNDDQRGDLVDNGPESGDKSELGGATPTPNGRSSPDKPNIDPPIGKIDPVFVLFTGTLRSEGKSNILSVPAEASSVTLRLTPKTIDYKTFQAQLTDADGNILLRLANLKARRSALDLSVPAELLIRGDYVVNLYGKNASGENESVADFQFRVVR